MSAAISPTDSQDVAFAKFIGFVSCGRGHPGPHHFTHFLWNRDLRMSVMGEGRTRQAAFEDASSKAVARHMQAAFQAQQAIDKAFSPSPDKDTKHGK